MLTCALWPGDRQAAVGTSVRASGAPTILVVGSTGDPATPYVGAVSLSKELESAVLLTRDGPGHSSTFNGDPTIDAAVEAYLLELSLPAAGATCR